MNFQNEFEDIIVRNASCKINRKNICEIHKLYSQLRHLYDTKISNVQERRYHTFSHILDCINALKEEFSNLSQSDYDDLFIALAYHDIAYKSDAKSGDNEALSSCVFGGICSDILDEDRIKRIEHLILKTNHFESDTEIDYDMCDPIIQDIDLLGLGGSWEKFQENSDLIRMEFSHVSDEDFNIGRSEFYNNMLNRGVIFKTSRCFKKYEEQARHNITRALKKMEL